MTNKGTITVGSLNKTKVTAVKQLFHSHSVQAVDVSSGVSLQPFGDEETLLGAVNRAKNAMKARPCDKAIGLEGGVMVVNDILYLNSWGALLTRKNELFTASGPRIELPTTFRSQLEAGTELSVLLERYTQRKNIRHDEGAIGIFTNDTFMRTDLFIYVVQLLKGQMKYASEQRN